MGYENDASVSTTYDTSNLRKWLNVDFVKKAFSTEEKAIILTTEVVTELNPYYGTGSGKSTKDKVFLLSVSEAEAYFSSDAERCCVAQGSQHSEGWWLRTQGDGAAEILLTAVYGDGSISYDGIFLTNKLGIRPAMWINLDSFEKYVKNPGQQQSETQSIEQSEELQTKPQEIITVCEVGGRITHGRYEQYNWGAGTEKINWIVLEIQDNKALVVSEYALDYMKYNADRESVGWEECTLREWLNNDFFESAFNEVEKAMICTATNDSVNDKIFLLSVNELNNYQTINGVKQCESSSYTLNKMDDIGQERVPDSGLCSYWTRSFGGDAATIMSGRGNDSYDIYVDEYAVVRPAMWVELSL